MSEETVFLLHCKSAKEEYVKAAIKAVSKEGCDFRVLVLFNKKEKPKIVREALDRDARINCGSAYYQKTCV